MQYAINWSHKSIHICNYMRATLKTKTAKKKEQQKKKKRKQQQQRLHENFALTLIFGTTTAKYFHSINNNAFNQFSLAQFIFCRQPAYCVLYTLSNSACNYCVNIYLVFVCFFFFFFFFVVFCFLFNRAPHLI